MSVNNFTSFLTSDPRASYSSNAASRAACKSVSCLLVAFFLVVVFLVVVFLGAAFLVVVFLVVVFLVVVFLAVVFLGAVFSAAAFLGAAFLGAAFLGAAFLGAGFVAFCAALPTTSLSNAARRCLVRPSGLSARSAGLPTAGGVIGVISAGAVSPAAALCRAVSLGPALPALG